MADIDELFVFDFSQVVGKLHLAAQQAIPNSIVINTGILNLTKKGDPKNPGDTKFDFGSKDGKYEVAIVKTISYRVDVKPELNKQLAKLVSDLLKYKKDHPEDADEEKKTEDDDKKKEAAEDTELTKIQDSMLKMFDSYKLKDYKKTDIFEESLASFKAAIKSENKARLEEYESTMKKTRAAAFKDMKEYLITYAGKDSIKSLTEDSLAVMNIDIDGKFNDPAKYEHITDYKFDPEALKQEVEDAEKKLQMTKPNDYMTRSIGFVAGYEKIDKK